jgi:hypothetical protein
VAVTAIYDPTSAGGTRLGRPPGSAAITKIGIAPAASTVVDNVATTNTLSTCYHTGGVGANSTTMGTDSTPVVTETYIAEILIPENVTLTGISLLNGSAVAGNVFVGLANSAGVNVAVGTSTAQAGTAAFQQFAFTATYATPGPGKYYVTVQFNNVAARYRSHVVGNFGASKKTGETFGTFTTITAPTTFTTGLGPVADVY